MTLRMAALIYVAASLLSCKGDPGAPGAAGSAAPAASGDADVQPAIELTSPKPRWSLQGLTDKQLESMMKKAGWTPTVVGKTPPAEGQSTIRVAAMRKDAGKQIDAVAMVRCNKPGDKPPELPAGEAYFRDGDCRMNVVVRLGIRNKSADSKALLETLLAADPG